MKRIPALALAALATSCAHTPVARQTEAPDFTPEVAAAAWPAGEGPLVLVDEGHCNYHTAAGRYAPFSELLRRDGYRVEPHLGGFTAESLAGADVLVIANALSREKCRTWELPAVPAFEPEEIAVLTRWVEGGGALLLIADHMPFPGAAAGLARAFDLVFIDGYARPDAGGATVRFDRESGSLGEHAIAAGREEAERVDAVVSFTGQGFRALREVEALLTLPSGTTLHLPREAGTFEPTTPRFSAEGLLQGAVFQRGQGRVAVFGEAAMFSAQEIAFGDQVVRMGMNAPGAERNAQFVLNLLHWLSGLL